MEDSELQAIRQARLRELQAQHAETGGSKSTEEDSEQKRTLAGHILQSNRRDETIDVARISMVKADKARAVEDLLIRMAQTGQLRGKVSESQLIEILEQINQQQKPETKIVYNRRKFDDEDEDDYNL
ncbi:programmed cell death protein 5-like protein [Rhizophagus diaphanus]|nr:programmed cell death protein 5-like protein [Rhizophagus diaphanus] [Rhizophagus sp. MUCL 43196]